MAFAFAPAPIAEFAVGIEHGPDAIARTHRIAHGVSIGEIDLAPLGRFQAGCPDFLGLATQVGACDVFRVERICLRRAARAQRHRLAFQHDGATAIGRDTPRQMETVAAGFQHDRIGRMRVLSQDLGQLRQRERDPFRCNGLARIARTHHGKCEPVRMRVQPVHQCFSFLSRFRRHGIPYGVHRSQTGWRSRAIQTYGVCVPNVGEFRQCSYKVTGSQPYAASRASPCRCRGTYSKHPRRHGASTDSGGQIPFVCCSLATLPHYLQSREFVGKLTIFRHLALFSLFFFAFSRLRVRKKHPSLRLRASARDRLSTLRTSCTSFPNPLALRVAGGITSRALPAADRGHYETRLSHPH